VRWETSKERTFTLHGDECQEKDGARESNEVFERAPTSEKGPRKGLAGTRTLTKPEDCDIESHMDFRERPAPMKSLRLKQQVCWRSSRTGVRSLEG
jgi:hypothetical protein